MNRIKRIKQIAEIGKLHRELKEKREAQKQEEIRTLKLQLAAARADLQTAKDRGFEDGDEWLNEERCWSAEKNIERYEKKLAELVDPDCVSNH